MLLILRIILYLFVIVGTAHTLPMFASFNDVSSLNSLTTTLCSYPEFERMVIKPNRSFDTAITQKALEECLDEFYTHHTLYKKTSVTTSVWAGRPIDFTHNTIEERYVQKLIVSPDAILCVMGDIHGSMHSLIRNLLRLQSLGFLNENLTITKKNFYMIFLGDYVDRGNWSVEVITMLCKLKLLNWEQVFLLAGNHENKEIANRYGLEQELAAKYSPFQSEQLLNTIHQKFFMLLPVALFITCNNASVQCCHGGIAIQYQPKEFLQQPHKLFQNVGTADNCLGLYWSDFCSGTSGRLCANHSRGFADPTEAIIADQTYTRTYLKDNNLNALIRAHQDNSFGLKVFYRQSTKSTLTGLHHWTKVLASLGTMNNTFNLSLLDYYPVLTFSSAVEGRGFPFDCFGLITTKSSWDLWTIRVYELFLGKNEQAINRHGAYLHISNNINDAQTELMQPSGTAGKDPINVYWKHHPENNTCIKPSTEISLLKSKIDEKQQNTGLKKILSFTCAYGVVELISLMFTNQFIVSRLVRAIKNF